VRLSYASSMAHLHEAVERLRRMLAWQAQGHPDLRSVAGAATRRHRMV